jgi:hypothetical protein
VLEGRGFLIRAIIQSEDESHPQGFPQAKPNRQKPVSNRFFLFVGACKRWLPRVNAAYLIHPNHTSLSTGGRMASSHESPTLAAARQLREMWEHKTGDRLGPTWDLAFLDWITKWTADAGRCCL